MKTIHIILLVSIVAFLSGFLFRGLFIPEKQDPIEIPVYTPQIIQQTDTIEVEKIIKYKVDNIIVDSLYYKKYIQERDKAAQLALFLNAITVRTYNENLIDNDTISIDVWSETRGSLLRQSAKYTIKQREILVPVELPKQPSLIINGGVFVNLPQVGVNPSIGLKTDILVNKNRSVISLGYDTNKTISIGYSKYLFKLK